MNELDLELRAKRLERENLVRVSYQALRWSAPEAWSAARAHSVALAVYLETESGRRFRFGWADELGLHHGHGISVDEVRVVDRDAGPVSDVSDAWQPWLRRPITSASVHWRDIADAALHRFTLIAVGGDYLRRRDYPQSIEIGFEGASLFISAARLTPEGAEGFTNNLLVIFSRAELERLKL